MERKVALITGVTGQGGSFLSELSFEKGYEMHGIIHHSNVDFRERIAHFEGCPNSHLHYGDISDSMSIMQIVGKVRPKKSITLSHRST